MTETVKFYMAAHRAMVRQDFESDGCRCIVVLHDQGVFTARADAETIVAKLNEEGLRELMLGEQVETVEELVEIVGQEQVDAVRQMYFVQEVELNEDEVSRQERLEKDLLAFVNELIHGPGASQVYIAVVENNEGTYDLEVEVDPDTIGGMFATGTSDLERARSVAYLLDALLKDRNITVFPTLAEWEAAWDED